MNIGQSVFVENFVILDHRLATSSIGKNQFINLKALLPSELLCNPALGNYICQCSPLSTAEFVGICPCQ